MNAKLKRKAIICIETNISYCSISEAARQTGIKRENIKTAINGHRLSAGGYHWALAKDLQKQQDLKKLNGKCKPVKAKIICIETGAEYESITVAAKAVGIVQSAISQHLSGRTKTAGGYH